MCLSLLDKIIATIVYKNFEILMPIYRNLSKLNKKNLKIKIKKILGV